MGHSNKEASSSKSSHPSSHHHGSHHGSHTEFAIPELPSKKTKTYKPLSYTLSFLFVVNNLVISDNAQIEPNRWGIRCPPLYTSSYTGELTSPVFRYQDGRVTMLPQEQYIWHRDPSDDPTRFSVGSILGFAVDPTTNKPEWRTLSPYSTYTVFRGWHFQPVVFMGCDALTTDVDLTEMDTMYHPLSFAEERRGDGMVSLVGARHHLYAAGKHADWVGKLVPDSYRNPYSATLSSGGLAGELAVILGLMGLSRPHGRAAEAFASGWWQDRRWRGPRWEFRADTHGSPSPGPDDAPRGVLVHVCFDEIENPGASNYTTLSDWERRGIIVREPSR